MKGQNHIYIDTDAPGTGCWCVGVGYVEISGIVGFKVTNSTPNQDEKNVLWDNPDITVEFSDEVDPATLAGNITLEYRDQAGGTVDVPVTITTLSAKKVRVAPNANLKDGIRYMVTVKTGLKSKAGVALDAVTIWFFWTMVDLDGQTANVYPPETTSRDKLLITWFNTLRNKDLIQGKPVANRIYANWDPKNDVFDADEITEFRADVTFEYNGNQQTKNNITIKRPDKYQAAEKRAARNTVNFYHMGASADTEEKYTVKIKPVPQSGNKEFQKAATATMKKAKKNLETNIYACEMAGWYNGVIQSELQNVRQTFRNGVRLTEETMPVKTFTYEDKGTVPRGSGGFGMTFTALKYAPSLDAAINHGDDPNVDDDVCDRVRFAEKGWWIWKVEKEEYALVMDHLASLKPGSHDFVIGLAPNQAVNQCVAGLHYNHAILLPESQSNPQTTPHEIFHEYHPPITGPGCTPEHNNDGRNIEGFRVLGGANKSNTEGNGQVTNFNHFLCNRTTSYNASVVPIMNVWKIDPEKAWIRPDTYDHLMGTFATVAQLAQVTGDWLIVQGFVDENQNIEMVNPLYRTVQRNLQEPQGTTYRAELFTGENGTGSSLGFYNFDTEKVIITDEEGNMPTLDLGMFIFSIPFDDSAKSLVLTGPHNQIIMNSSDFGIRAPSITITSPAEGSTISGQAYVNWTGTDDGGDNSSIDYHIFYRLEYSPNGTDWIPLATQLADISAFRVDTTSLPPGPDQKFALIASDGFNVSRQEVGVTVDNGVYVRSTLPEREPYQDNVSVSQTILVDFGSEMDPSSIHSGTFTLNQGYNIPVAGQVSYDNETRRAVFMPLSPLQPYTYYTVRLIGGVDGVRDVHGNTLVGDYSWTFGTGETVAAPYITIVYPFNGATNVPLNPVIQAGFEKEMDAATLDPATFTLTAPGGTPVLGSVTYDSANKRAVFTSDTDLSPNTTYTATVTTDVKDIGGTPLESDYSWTFTTGSWKSAGIRVVGVNYDRAEDTDGDGLYDRLLVEVLIEMPTDKASSFYLSGQLRDSDGKDIGWNSSSQYLSTPGLYTFQLEFKGTDIAGHGVDGPFEVTNLYVYHSYDLTIYHAFPSSYRTAPYKASEFYSPIRMTALPEIAVGVNSVNEGVLNLEEYVTHEKYPVSDLQYRLLINSSPNAGVAISASHMLNVVPAADFTGFTDVLLEIRDVDGARALSSFRVNVLENYAFPGSGWAAFSLANLPTDTKIANVLASVHGKYDVVWGFMSGAWKSYDPDSPSGGDLGTLEPGWGYWIKMNQTGAFMSMGSSINGQSIDFQKGWNFVGFNSAGSLPIADALSSVAGRYLVVWSYQNGNWKLYDPDNPLMSDLTQMTPGYAYWINATENVTWTIK